MSSPREFRKKPVVIEAMEFEGEAGDAAAVISWILAGGGTARYHEPVEAGEEDLEDGSISMWPEDPEHIAIDTLEGTMRADIGDWVIRGVAGEFYPCKPGIFEATYEATYEAADR